MTDLHPAALSTDDTALIFMWSDGRSDRYPFGVLRDCCPCATCMVKRTEEIEQKPEVNLLPVLSPQEAGPLRLTSVEPVGNYAYSIHFSDGHNSGIYTLDLLRRLGDELHRVSENAIE
ncbi:DUF971 domain-containing protein [Planctomycetaceae bacterium]|jgi:DUF971 family protein|nr:DUF971 domain-containing protein [bacterium]MDB4787019.1 DUF971 domain-containing protein [Planctomycetaceae bacterium]MDC0273824.1 DUF971 domain-containing protein [Planctomycetaceae bacterium]